MSAEFQSNSSTEGSQGESFNKRRRVLSEDSREIIWNVYNYMKNLDLPGNIMKHVTAATGISKTTLLRIITDGKAIECGEKATFYNVPTPKASPKLSVDLTGEQAIRRIIYNFHVVEKRAPTVDSIYQKINDDETIGFTGKKTSLRAVLRKMGFKWVKSADNRKLLMEGKCIRQLRCAYIRSITNFRKAERTIVYTDETYIHASHTTHARWADGTAFGLKSPIAKGKRLIIVHAGGKDGFVNNALLIFKSGQKSGDYHDDMNFINYKKWLDEQLIPNLPKNSVVVMDNASYPNVLAVKRPTSTTRKAEMICWLNERGLKYDEKWTKPELYDVIKINKPSYIQYTVDQIFAQHGHVVCRLPPYHPELNPIEKVWGIAKNWVATRNVTFKLDDVEKLISAKFAAITAVEWNQVCRHVIEIEQHYIEKEYIMDDLTEKIIIHANTGSSEEDFGLSSDEEN